MASSRVFIRGLPPTLTESDFRKHFSQQGTVTDARLFQKRRIGYIGYDSPDIAAKAVKYFNRTFMRMSKIAVEIAAPVKAQQVPSSETAKVKTSGPAETSLNHGKRKRGRDEPDPELSMFLETMRPNKPRKDLHDVPTGPQPSQLSKIDDIDNKEPEVPLVQKEEPIKRRKVGSGDEAPAQPVQAREKSEVMVIPEQAADTAEAGIVNKTSGDQDSNSQSERRSDSDWLRSRTSRLLGLEDDDDDDERDNANARVHPPRSRIEKASDSEDEAGHPLEVSQSAQPIEESGDDAVTHEPDAVDQKEKKIRDTSRLYIRNLAYDVTDEDLHSSFAPFGKLIEVHIPTSGKTGAGKGFAYVLFDNPDSAVNAWREKDGTSFKGRLLHILPATAKRETQLDDFALSKLPLKKQQQIKKRREAASAQYNWNSLYMNADAVLSSVADRFGISKSDMLDPTSSDAAVKQAHAETHLISETKAYFKKNGVDLDAFKTSSRGDTAILIKNIPYDAKSSEIRDMFEQHGKLKAFLVPPSGVIAIAAYEQPAHAKAAFAALAYRKLHNSVLFLERAPKKLFSTEVKSAPADETLLLPTKEKSDISASELHDHTAGQATTSATLFVRNLNFSTTTERLVETFSPLDGFLTARVKTRTDPKKPGQILSMGFGFVEFRSTSQAEAALATMNDYMLDHHRLQVRFSQKFADAAEARREEDKSRRKDSASTKIVIKNLPFEATKKDIRSLFGAYGQLRSVRMPMKMDRSIRGLAFADFTTQKEATNALDALRDTHLLGRRLVLDYAAPEAEDAEAEIERMQKKVGSQINKVALQNLTGSGRKKFSVDDPAANDEADE